MNNNNNSNQNTGGGRRKGNRNKYTPEARKILFDVLGEKHISRLDKLIGGVSFDSRLTSIKPFAKILCSESDEVGEKTRRMIFEGLKEQFHPNRFRTYFNQLPQEKKVSEMRQFLQMLTKEQIEALFKGIT